MALVLPHAWAGHTLEWRLPLALHMRMPLADPVAGQETTVRPTGVGRGLGLELRGRRLGKAGAVAASIGRQIAEIREDPALRGYGVGLALVNVLTVLFWYSSGELRYFDVGTEPICWPLVPGCAAWRVLTAAQARVL